MATTLRVSEVTRARAASLAAQAGSSIGAVVGRAFDAYEKAEFWRQTHEALARHDGEADVDSRGNSQCGMDSMTSDVRRSEVWVFDFSQPVGQEQGRQRPALMCPRTSGIGTQVSALCCR